MILINRLKRAYHYSVNYFKIEKFFKDKYAKYYVVDGGRIRKTILFGMVDMMRIETYETDDDGDYRIKLDSTMSNRNFTMVLDPETVKFNKQMSIMKYIKHDEFTGEEDTIYVTKDIMQVRKILKNIINKLILSHEKPSTIQLLYYNVYKAALSRVQSLISSI